MCSSSPSNTFKTIPFYELFLCLKYVERFLFSGLKNDLPIHEESLAYSLGQLEGKTDRCIQTSHCVPYDLAERRAFSMSVLRR